MTYIYKHALISTCVILAVSCKNERSDVSQTSLGQENSHITIDQNQFDNSEFELGKIEERSFSKILNCNGYIHIPEKSKASVGTPISGTVGSMNLMEGQWVDKGQYLFTVTNPELINLQEEYLITKGQLEYLTEEYNRLSALDKENLTSKKELLKAKSEYNTMQSRYAGLSKKISLYGINIDNLSAGEMISTLKILAPISGYVSKIDIYQGMYIEPSQSVILLMNTKQVNLELSVLEKDALLLKKDQKLSFTLQIDPSQEYKASVFLVNKLINNDKMISINCIIESNIKQLIPGMYANAKIILESYKTKALPESAIVQANGKHYALSLKKKEGTTLSFDKLSIETGQIQDGYVELLNPKSLSSEYLTKGAYFLIQ